MELQKGRALAAALHSLLGQAHRRGRSGCGSTSRGPEADLLSCLQGPDRRSRPGGPLARYPPFPAPLRPAPSPHGGLSRLRVAVTPTRGLGSARTSAQNLWPTPPRPSSLQAVTPQPEACLATGQPGRTSAPDFASRCLRAQLRPAAAGTARLHSSGEMAAASASLHAWRSCRHPGGGGNRKAVKSLRKHQDVGHFARDLAARWKKPLLVNPNTRPGPTHRTVRRALPESAWGLFRTTTPGASQKMRRSPGVDLTALSTDGQHTQHLRGSGDLSSSQSPGRNRESAPELPQVIPAPIGPLHQTQRDLCFCPRAWSPSSKPEEARLAAAQGRPLLARGCQGQPQAKRLGATARAQILPPEASRGCPGPWAVPASSRRHPPGPAPEETPRPPSRESARDRPPSASAGTQKEGGRHGGSGLGLPAWAVAPGGHPERPSADTHTGRGRVWTARTPRKGHHGLSAGDPETQERKPPAAPLDATSVGSLSEVEEGEEAEELEQPTLSFEQYLAYDQVQKKEKDCEIFRHTHVEINNGEQAVPRALKATPRGYGRPVLIPPGRETVLGQGFSELWDLSEPWMQANYDLLSPLTTDRSERSAPAFRAETGASGGRVNAKMQVYSGSRPARQPQGLTLRQQCVRALRDNPDVLGQGVRLTSYIAERKTITHSLERQTDYGGFAASRTSREKSRRSTSLGGSCTSGRHARAAAAVVTANIRAAHENKPQGRQAKMICFNSTPDARGGKRSLQEPLTQRQHQARSPSTRNSHPPSSEAGGTAAAASRAP
ncbi:LOW QUALITY PROTEIN: Elongin-A2 [Plecturocebus cupreus]